MLVERPGDLLVVVAALWMTTRLVGLLASGASGRPTPFDAIATDRLALGRFLGWWIGLTTAILASMPLLALAALTLTHFVIRWTAR